MVGERFGAVICVHDDGLDHTQEKGHAPKSSFLQYSTQTRILEPPSQSPATPRGPASPAGDPPGSLSFPSFSSIPPQIRARPGASSFVSAAASARASPRRRAPTGRAQQLHAGGRASVSASAPAAARAAPCRRQHRWSSSCWPSATQTGIWVEERDDRERTHLWVGSLLLTQNASFLCLLYWRPVDLSLCDPFWVWAGLWIGC